MFWLDRFRFLLEARGADLTRWPIPSRLFARLLLALSAEARRVRAEAARLDAILTETLAPEPAGPELTAALHALAARLPQPTPPRALFWPPRRFVQLGTAAALASVLAGFLFGAAGPLAPIEEPSFDLAAVAYGEIPESPVPLGDLMP
jgi:hypothetical protein